MPSPKANPTPNAKTAKTAKSASKAAKTAKSAKAAKAAKAASKAAKAAKAGKAAKSAKTAKTRKPAPGGAATLEPTGPVPEQNQPGYQPESVPDKPTEPPKAYRETRTFPFRFERLLRPLSAVVGVLPRTARVEVDGVELRIRFGLWSLVTPLDNVAGTEVTGPYQFVKVAGPPHISLADRGVTFATNRQRGLCIRFRDPVSAALPYGLVDHPAATVTVEDPEALAAALTSTTST